MTCFVISSIALFLVRHDHRFALCAHHDFVFGQFKLFHFHNTFTGARGKQGGFVHQVGQISTRETRSTTSNNARLDIITHRHFAHVDLENLLATTNIRQTNHNLTVKTTWTQERRVQHVRTVSGGNHNDAVIHLKAVHLNQQLVKGLLTLIMTAAHTVTTVTTDSINFIDEDNARRVLFSLLKHVTNTAGTNTHEHFNEVRTGNRKKRNLGFTSNRLGDQSFTGPRRANHQHTTRDSTAQTLKLARIAEELNQLTHFFLRFITAGHISQGRFDLVFR